MLRPLTVADAEDAFAWTSDQKVAEFMLYNRHEKVDTTREWLKSLETLENEYTWGIVRKPDNKLIGACSIRLRTNEQKWSFGYNIRSDCWNNGYATEAARCILQYVREKHGAKNFIAEHAEDNPASGRVIEKCGLHFTEYSEYTSFDGKRTYKSKVYELNEGE